MTPDQQSIYLPEWATREVSGVSLTTSDQRFAEELRSGGGGRLSVDETRSGIRITASSWVGVVRFEHFEVRVLPKLAGDNLGLVEMVEFTTGLDALKRSSGARSIAAGGDNLFDLIALLLAEECDRLVRGGLFADYVEHEDELPVVRGRILADRQVLRRFGQVDRVMCRFDDREHDVFENQLLAAALDLCSRRVDHAGVSRHVRRLSSIFREVCSTGAFEGATARRQIAYHRLNQHYRQAHCLAQLVLESLGAEDLLEAGSTRCFAFLIDMNLLFERFVHRLLERLLPAGYRLYYQRSDRSIIWNADDNRPYAAVIPDLLVQHDGESARCVPLDAKYKLYDERKLSSDDIYQCFLYAYAYGGTGVESVPRAVLVYPSLGGSQEPLRLRVQSAQKVAGAEILALGIHIPTALKEARERRGGPGAATLLEAIKRATLTPVSVAA